MRNYLKAELYRNFKRMYLWGIIIGIVGFGVIGCILLKNISFVKKSSLEMVLMMAMGITSSYSYFMLMFAEMSIGEEFKNNTIKNIGSAGLSRSKIYVTKVIEAILLMLFCSIVAFVGVVLFGGLILGIEDMAYCKELVSMCISRSSAIIFLWIPQIALGMLLYLLVKSGGVISCIYILLLAMLGNILAICGKYIDPIFIMMNKYLPSTMIKAIANAEEISNGDLVKSALIGIIYTVILTGIGISVLKRKDI